jgi:hypothetical protein
MEINFMEKLANLHELTQFTKPAGFDDQSLKSGTVGCLRSMGLLNFKNNQ